MLFLLLSLAATALVEGKIGKTLKKVLKKVVAKEAHEQLAITDAKLGGVIKVSTSPVKSTSRLTEVCFFFYSPSLRKKHEVP